jgi:Cytochrome c554 and c-prime
MTDVLASRSCRLRPEGPVLLFVLVVATAVAAVLSLRRTAAPVLAPLAPIDSSSVSLARPGSVQPLVAAYATDGACRDCHPGEWALFSRSGHHRTLHPALGIRLVSWLNGRKVVDPELPGITWSYHVRQGRLMVDRELEGRTKSLSLDYALGSGKHGITFVALPEAGDPGAALLGIEHRMSYFPEHRLGITPGQQRDIKRKLDEKAVDFGREVPPERLLKCFACHATATSATGYERLDTSTMIPNVSCERCHGPGLAHVNAARRGGDDLRMRFGSARVEPSVEVEFCGECHRLPEAVPSSWLEPENLNIVRFQGVGLSLSRCYADGLREIRCTSCHEPHARVSGDRGLYNGVCLSCHRTTTGQASCPVSPESDCTRCHMPRRELPGSGAFTDHWIRRPTPGRASTP